MGVVVSIEETENLEESLVGRDLEEEEEVRASVLERERGFISASGAGGRGGGLAVSGFSVVERERGFIFSTTGGRGGGLPTSTVVAERDSGFISSRAGGRGGGLVVS